MPRRSQKGGNAVTVAHGQVLVEFAAAANVFQLLVTPSGSGMGFYSPKLAQLSDVFQLYRFTKLRIRALRSVNTGVVGGLVSQMTAIGFTAESSVTQPSTQQAVMELPCSLALGSADVQILRIPSSALRAHGVPWFNTVPGSAAQDLVYQGYITASTFGATDTVRYQIDYTIELKDFVGPTQTPKRVPLLCASESYSDDDEKSTGPELSNRSSGPIGGPAVRVSVGRAQRRA